MNGKTLILGVGAQKTGTSWLNRQLISNPSIDCGSNKEKSILNCCNEGFKYTISNLQDNLNFISELDDIHNNSYDLKCDSEGKYLLSCQHNFREILKMYFERLNSFWEKNKEINYFVDISPKYATLNSDQYTAIKSYCSEHSINLKVIYIMRDPIERVISSGRAKVKRDRKEGINCPLEKIIRERFCSSQNIPYSDRGNYKYVIDALTNGLNPSDYLLLIYEHMFNSNEFFNIENFLGTKLAPPNFDQKVHSGRGPKGISIELEQQLFLKYKPIYKFMSEKLGNSYPSEWRSIDIN